MKTDSWKIVIEGNLGEVNLTMYDLKLAFEEYISKMSEEGFKIQRADFYEKYPLAIKIGK